MKENKNRTPDCRHCHIILCIIFVILIIIFNGIIIKFINNLMHHLANSIPVLEDKDAPALKFLIVTISLCGFVGGVTGGLYDKKKKAPTRLEGALDCLTFGFSGIICAFGIVVLTTSFSGMLKTPMSLNDCLFIIAISLLSGFFAFRLLPHLGDNLEKKIAKAKEEVKEEVKEDVGKIRKLTEENDNLTLHNELLVKANLAFSQNNPIITDEVLKLYDENINKFKNNGTLNIYYGRLYKMKKQYVKAIEALKAFTKNTNQAEALKATYFNIACYISLLAEENNDKSLLTEVLENLKKAYKFNNNIFEYSKYDSDLDYFWTIKTEEEVKEFIEN